MNLVNKTPVRLLSLSSTNCVGANSDYTRLRFAAALASNVNRLGEPGRNRLCWPVHLCFEVVLIAAIAKPRQTDRVVAPNTRNLPVMSTEEICIEAVCHLARFDRGHNVIACRRLCAVTADGPQDNAKNTNVVPEAIPAGTQRGKDQHPTHLPAAQPGGAGAGKCQSAWIRRRRSSHAACCSAIPTKPWPA